MACNFENNILKVVSFHVSRMRLDLKIILKPASVGTKNYSGAAITRAAVKPVSTVSSRDFFSVRFQTLITKRTSSNVYSCLRTVGASCTTRAQQTILPIWMQTQTPHLLVAARIAALMVLEAVCDVFATWMHCLDSVLTV